MSRPSSANSSAPAISVPPSARSFATQARACCTFSAVAGSAAGHIGRVEELNSTTLKRSRGVSVERPVARACFACWMEVPCIEPEVSMTKTVSRGIGGERGLLLGAWAAAASP